MVNKLKLNIHLFDSSKTEYYAYFHVNGELYKKVLLSAEGGANQYVWLSNPPPDPSTSNDFIGWRFNNIIYLASQITNREFYGWGDLHFYAVFNIRKLKIGNKIVKGLKISNVEVVELKLNGEIIYANNYE